MFHRSFSSLQHSEQSTKWLSTLSLKYLRPPLAAPPYQGCLLQRFGFFGTKQAGTVQGTCLPIIYSCCCLFSLVFT